VVSLYDDYAEMIEHLCAHHYLTTTRYTTNAFLRVKMQEALSRRGIAPHVFERRDEAHAFLDAAERERGKGRPVASAA